MNVVNALGCGAQRKSKAVICGYGHSRNDGHQQNLSMKKHFHYIMHDLVQSNKQPALLANIFIAKARGL